MCALGSNANRLNHSILQGQSATVQSNCTKQSPSNVVIPDNAIGTQWKSSLQNSASMACCGDQANTQPMAENDIMPTASTSSKCHHPDRNDLRYAMEENFQQLQIAIRGARLPGQYKANAENLSMIAGPEQSLVRHNHFNTTRCLNEHPLWLARIGWSFLKPIVLARCVLQCRAN